MSTMTPYAAAKVINETLKQRGIEKKLPPQMFYTYVGKGYIPSTTTENGKKVVTREDLLAWFEGYFEKHHTTTPVTDEVDPDQLELDLDTDES